MKSTILASAIGLLILSGTAGFALGVEKAEQNNAKAANLALAQKKQQEQAAIAAMPKSGRILSDGNDHPRATPKLDILYLNATTSPEDGTYGVAATLKVTFNNEIPEGMRGPIQKGFVVKSTKKLSPGAWVWLTGDSMTYRTKDFLPAHSVITLKGPGTNKFLMRYNNIVYKMENNPITKLDIARNMTTTVDDASHSATVAIDGTPVRTMGVSMGQPGYETRSGIKATGEKYDLIRMTSQSVNISDPYDLEVPYAVRLTDSGEFIHAAPWAEDRIGVYDGSHGCTNLTLDDGQWFYNESLQYDPVITQGTGRTMETDNGNGGIWNYTWAQWKAMSIPTTPKIK